MGKFDRVNGIINWLDKADAEGVTGNEKLLNLMKVDIKGIEKNILTFTDDISKFKQELGTLTASTKNEVTSLEISARNQSATLSNVAANAGKVIEILNTTTAKLAEKQSEFDTAVADNGVKIKNKIAEIDDNLQKIADLFKSSQTQYKELQKTEKSAKDILALSTSAGLAGFYTDKISKLDKEITTQRWIFMGVNIALSIVAIGLVLSDPSMLNNFDYVKLLSRLAVFASISLPLLWIAKQNGELLRQNLQILEEYEHKKALAATYVGYKDTLETLGLQSDDEKKVEAILYLVEETTKGIMKNPATTLPKSKKERMPLEEAILVFTEGVKMLNTVPEKIKETLFQNNKNQ